MERILPEFDLVLEEGRRRCSAGEFCDRLRQFLRRGSRSFPEGGALAPERQVAARYGIGRGTVHKAYEQLAAEEGGESSSEVKKRVERARAIQLEHTIELWSIPTIKNLVKQGYLRLEAVSGDRRNKTLSFTEEGVSYGRKNSETICPCI